MFDQQKITQTIAEILGVSPQDIDKNNTLRGDLGLGPIALNDLISNLSVRFDVTFDLEDISGLETVADLIDLVEDNLI